MVAHRPSSAGRRRAAHLSDVLASEVALARASAALTVAQVARRAEVSPSTVARIESGEPGVHLDTISAVCDAVGLQFTARVFPARDLSLRDSGQLRIAQFVCAQLYDGWRARLEQGLGDGSMRAADVVLYGVEEVLDMEIERRLLDYQGQYRRIASKRDELQRRLDRPVRLVMVVEDTRRNRAVLRPFADIVGSSFPASSKEVWRSLRTGRPLGRDGLLWVRAGPSEPPAPMNG